ncbi:MAG: hypothetical protein U0P30_10000 [Vicinamibacterales bacterium]
MRGRIEIQSTQGQHFFIAAADARHRRRLKLLSVGAQRFVLPTFAHESLRPTREQVHAVQAVPA